MPIASRQFTTLSTTSDPFKYVGGDPAVDFVNTVDWAKHGLVRDRLTSYDRLVEWGEGAGILSRAVAEELRAAARHSAKRRDDALTSALGLRLTLQQLFGAVAAGAKDAQGLANFDRYLERAFAARTLAYDTSSRGRARRASAELHWTWRDASSLDFIIWTVTWSAATLLVSPDANRLRVCGGDDCGWMFVDRSRNGLRRWCEMGVCGTKEKNRRRSANSA